MNFKYILISVLTISLLSCKSERENAKRSDSLTWIDIEKAGSIGQNGSNKKLFLIDVYTDWCHWCKVMDQKTFSDPKVIAYLNEHFHVVKFDAEIQRTVDYKGKKYEWVESGRNGVNSLALELLQGRLSYPTIVYLDEQLNPITISPGYKTPEQLMAELEGLN